TDVEYFDNIVAFWRPLAGLRAGVPFAFAYTLNWSDDTPPQSGLRVYKTRIGAGGKPGTYRFIIDFVGRQSTAAKLDLPAAVVRASHGTCGPPHVRPNPYTGGVRVSFELDPGLAKWSDLSVDLIQVRSAPESWRYRWLRR
ncbi:MAG: glucan biosynthesis protein, partial [Hyphomicrobium sp.]